MTLSVGSDLRSDSIGNFFVKCPSDRLQKLLHHLIDLFCGQNKSLYSSYCDIYSLLEWWDLISCSKKYFKEIYSQNASVPQNLEPLPSEHQKIIKDVLEIRNLDLKNRLIDQSHAVCPAYLKSFDWKLKLTLASDKMSQINEPRLLLDLDITGDKLLRLDLTKDELKSLIDTLEKAKTAVVDLTVD